MEVKHFKNKNNSSPSRFLKVRGTPQTYSRVKSPFKMMTRESIRGMNKSGSLHLGLTGRAKSHKANIWTEEL